MIRVSRLQAVLLAALLDADGWTVPYADLGDAVGTYDVNASKVVRQYVHRLVARGVDCVAVVDGVGCRLTGLPPDEVLPDVLAMLDALRQDARRPALPVRRIA